MIYDREADILYLAHYLWEEAGAPAGAAPAYWKEAALQVLARGGKHAPSHNAVVNFDVQKPSAKRSLSLCLTRAKHGRAICVDAMGQRRVTFVPAHEQVTVANSPLIDLARKVD
jgi:hypothetical protein